MSGNEAPSQQLSELYPRQDGCPVISGDQVLLEDESGVPTWAEVRFFKWRGTKDPATPGDMYEVSDGSGTRDLTADTADKRPRRLAGERPAAKLREVAVHRATAAVHAKFERLLARTLLIHSGRRLTGRAIFEAIGSNGHDVWIVGGMVRDLCRDAEPLPDKEMDLDVAGTVPFHRIRLILADLIDQFELQARLNEDHNVLILRPVGQKPILEYAPLKGDYRVEDGFVFDHDLKVDILYRDLSMNCLFYDPLADLLFDPAEHGRDDAVQRRLRPITPPLKRPLGHAAITLFRLLKFLARPDFGSADLSETKGFIDTNLNECLDDFRQLSPILRVRVLLRFYGTTAAMEADEPSCHRLASVCARVDPALFQNLQTWLP